MKRTSIISIFLFVTVIVVACSDDDDVFVAQPKAPMSKDDVLATLESSYNERNIAAFKKLLDDDFVFYFSDWDYNSGEVPFSWEWTEEVFTTTNMFDSNYQGPNRALNILLDLVFEKDDWTEVPQDDGPGWYRTEVVYYITVQTVSGVDYKGYRMKAEVVIREVVREDESEKIWCVVQWKDLGGDYSSLDAPASNAVAECTWGRIKALYQ